MRAVAPPDRWTACGVEIRVDRPLILGVLNRTPDSFSDGGRYPNEAAAVDRALAMVDAGADLIDVGGESSRPGADPVDAETEWRRVGTVVGALAAEGVLVSVDTTKSTVARRAIDAGASVINDISGLVADAAVGEVAADTGAGLILMHMRGTPRTMQDDVEYADLPSEVRGFLAEALRRAERAGCDPGQLVVDPGIGFGKSVAGNLELIAELEVLTELGRPVLVGPSRKSFIGSLLDVPVDQRVEGTIAACVSALERGARLFRVHDVRASRRALDMAWAILSAGG